MGTMMVPPRPLRRLHSPASRGLDPVFGFSRGQPGHFQISVDGSSGGVRIGTAEGEMVNLEFLLRLRLANERECAQRAK